ncbi:hypothetical protein AAY473_007594 [Plecturocebus cupreus]
MSLIKNGLGSTLVLTVPNHNDVEMLQERLVLFIKELNTHLFHELENLREDPGTGRAVAGQAADPCQQGEQAEKQRNTKSLSDTRLECSGAVSAHCNVCLPVQGLILSPRLECNGMISEMRFHYLAQAGLKLLSSDDPPASASQKNPYQYTPELKYAETKVQRVK